MHEIPVTHEAKADVRIIKQNIDTYDSYVDDSFDKISDIIDKLSQDGYYGDSQINIARKRRSEIDMNNPATRDFLRQVPTAEHWLSMVPTVFALNSLYNPRAETYSNGERTSVEAREWLSNCLDGVGIRSRASVVRGIVSNELKDLSHGKVVSLACGAAQPVLGGIKDVINNYGYCPEVTLVDLDKRALKYAKEYATSSGIDRVNLRHRNILSPAGVADTGNGAKEIVSRALYGKSRLVSQSYDVVEAVGILEYLKADDWKYSYNGVLSTDRPMSGAVSFLKNSYQLLKPGGAMILGNMLDTHPQLGFTLNVIQWPHIQPRSIDEMNDIFNRAGLGSDRIVYLPKDGVYGVYVIRKPEGSS